MKIKQKILSIGALSIFFAGQAFAVKGGLGQPISGAAISPLNLRWVHEFEAVNRVEGDLPQFAGSFKF